MLAPLILAVAVGAPVEFVPEPPFLVCVVLKAEGQFRRTPAPIPDSFHDTYEEAAARRQQIVRDGWIGSTADGGEEEYGPTEIRRAVLGNSSDQRFCGPAGARPRGRLR